MRRLLAVRIRAKNFSASLATVGLLVSIAVSEDVKGDVLSQIKDSNRIVQYSYQVDASIFKGNVSIIEQQGNNNKASTVQSHSAYYQLANFSHIHQRGNNNLANIYQLNGNNVGVIWQVGNNHNANIYQQGNSISFRADIYQLGSSGDVTISQSGSGLRGVSVQQQGYSGNTRPVTIDTY